MKGRALPVSNIILDTSCSLCMRFALVLVNSDMVCRCFKRCDLFKPKIALSYVKNSYLTLICKISG